jgi:hypothetical protein
MNTHDWSRDQSDFAEAFREETFASEPPKEVWLCKRCNVQSITPLGEEPSVGKSPVLDDDAKQARPLEDCDTEVVRGIHES